MRKGCGWLRRDLNNDTIFSNKLETNFLLQNFLLHRFILVRPGE